MNWLSGKPRTTRSPRLFLDTKLPPGIYDDLEAFLEQVRYPLAVRSSSLLEDSQFQPFAGVYATYMLANNHEDLKVRLDQLCDAIKLVYASAYSARGQELHRGHQQPDRGGEDGGHHPADGGPAVRDTTTTRTSRAWPTRPTSIPRRGMEPEDGVAAVALGLGRTVVEGGQVPALQPAPVRASCPSSAPSTTG